jgi:hypothetical protein
MSEDLLEAMAQITDAPKVMQRGGKTYTQVQDRIEAFRRVFAFDYGIETKLLKDDGKAILVQAIITDSEGRTIGSGLAEEVRGSSNVNTTSAIENGETSAIGRALASLGLHGGEYASANELDKVERMEKVKPPPPTLVPPPTVTENLAPPEDLLEIPEFLRRDDGQPTWAAEQIEGFKKHKHLGQHGAWELANRNTLESMKQTDPAGRTALAKAYQVRKIELTNKGVN